MRLPLIPPASSAPSRPSRRTCAPARQGLRVFKTAVRARPDRPVAPLAAAPKSASPIWELTKRCRSRRRCRRKVRRDRILVTARSSGRPTILRACHRRRGPRPADDKLARFVAGSARATFGARRRFAYGTPPRRWSESGVLPEPTLPSGVRAFGQDGAMELIYLRRLYCLVSVPSTASTCRCPDAGARNSCARHWPARGIERFAT